MKLVLPAVTLAFLTACATTTPPTRATSSTANGSPNFSVQNQRPPLTTSGVCPDKEKLSNKLSANDLYKSLSVCINQERYDSAVFIYALAGAFTRYDTLRVADKSAHQAARVLPMGAFNASSKEKVSAFQVRVGQTLGKDSERGKYCNEIEALGPPSYFPSYMVQHGLVAMSNSKNTQPLITPFDERSSWKQAVNEYLMCSKAVSQSR